MGDERRPHYWGHSENLVSKDGIEEWEETYRYFVEDKVTIANPNDILRVRDEGGYAKCLICDLLAIKHAIFWQHYPEFRRENRK